MLRVCADTKWSSYGATIVIPVFLAWMLTFMIGYDSVFSKSFVNKFDASRLDLEEYGWVF